MFRSIYLLFMVFALGIVSGYGQEKAKKINYAKEGYVKARVIKYDVDGCGFLIELADKAKTKLAPDKLPDDFKRKGKKMWVKYSLVKKPMMNTCMAGKQVEILDIKKRK